MIPILPLHLVLVSARGFFVRWPRLSSLLKPAFVIVLLPYIKTYHATITNLEISSIIHCVKLHTYRL
jgi:hypothetical protein